MEFAGFLEQDLLGETYLQVMESTALYPADSTDGEKQGFGTTFWQNFKQ